MIEREMNSVCIELEHLNLRLDSLEAIAETIPLEQGLRELDNIALRSAQLRQLVESLWSKIGTA